MFHYHELNSYYTQNSGETFFMSNTEGLEIQDLGFRGKKNPLSLS